MSSLLYDTGTAAGLVVLEYCVVLQVSTSPPSLWFKYEYCIGFYSIYKAAKPEQTKRRLTFAALPKGKKKLPVRTWGGLGKYCMFISNESCVTLKARGNEAFPTQTLPVLLSFPTDDDIALALPSHILTALYHDGLRRGSSIRESFDDEAAPV